MGTTQSIRYCYYFGYGANREVDMIAAITGNKPEVIAPALLHDYELRIQGLSETTANDGNPRAILMGDWNKDFKSYVIVPKKGSVVSGTLFRLPLHDRHAIDRWELVYAGWYDKAFVNVTTATGQEYSVETEVLAPPQQAAEKADGMNYSSWVVPKEDLLAVARLDRTRT